MLKRGALLFGGSALQIELHMLKTRQISDFQLVSFESQA